MANKTKAQQARETTLEGLSADTEVEIEHKDGRRFGVTMRAYRDLYAEQGFEVDRLANGTPIGEPETIDEANAEANAEGSGA